MTLQFNNNKYVVVLIFFIFLSFASFAQDCNFVVKGTVYDLNSNQPLDAVNVYFEENAIGAFTGADGFFTLNNVCKGSYHLILSHIGCESQEIHIDVEKDTTLALFLEHTHTTLENITISESSAITSQTSESLSEQNISDNSNENLSRLLDNITGVSTLSNGGQISKPVVHGLSGNRLSIINNGITQSGQLWGVDHGPEIDPLASNKIRVLKGVNALEYLGSNLGSVVIIESKNISKEAHLHGKSRFFYESNGRSFGINTQLQKYNNNWGWKFNGTFKKGGDRSTPNYLLRNTGYDNTALTLQLEKELHGRHNLSGLLSVYTTRLGVLRGSHIGNTTDLEQALERDVPFFTRDSFTYNIEAPKQDVDHFLSKIKYQHYLSDSESISLTAAGQINIRKEFDVRRGNRTDIPSLKLDQYTLYGEGKYSKEFNSGLLIKSGLQVNLTDNTNDPETQILPLIPDYFLTEGGIYLFTVKSTDNKTLNIGGRYDIKYQDAATISSGFPREIIHYKRTFHNFSGLLGYSVATQNNNSFSFNLGYIKRNPAINELYSAGLHQGVSGIEEGNINLKSEHSFKSSIGYSFLSSSTFTLESLIYLHYINNYIYLQPQEQLRLTIRGAFPVFAYQQTDARLAGLDLSSSINLSKNLRGDASLSFINAKDLNTNLALINIPSNNYTLGIAFLPQKVYSIKNNILENIELDITYKRYLEQSEEVGFQDFTSPPAGYGLLDFSISADYQIKATRVRLNLSIDNLFNTTYRNYLNRLRYFADGIGRNVALSLTFKY